MSRTREWIELYHRTGHQGQGMEGATPLAIWQTTGTLRRADWNDLLFLMQSRGVYQVGRNGVRFKVGNATLGYGACEPKLYSLCGREVFITIDPADLSHCFAWTPQRDNRRFIAGLRWDRPRSDLSLPGVQAFVKGRACHCSCVQDTNAAKLRDHFLKAVARNNLALLVTRRFRCDVALVLCHS